MGWGDVAFLVVNGKVLEFDFRPGQLSELLVFVVRVR